MKRKIFNSRALALILVLAMAVSLLTISASAATSWSLTGHGTNIASITIDGADFYEPDYTTSTSANGTVYDYYIALNEATADGTIVSMHFTKAAGEPTDCVISRVPVVANPPQAQQIIWGQRANDYTATVNEGTALARAYVHKNIQSELGKFDTYVFHYYLPYPVSISTGDPVFIAWDGNNGIVAGRDGSSRIPGEFTLWVDGTNTITVDGVTVTSTYVNAGNYAFTISPKASGNTTIVAVSGGVTYTITCPAQNGTASTSIVKTVEGYLPVGQFARGSGWGTATGKFTTSGYESTGVSLGAAGGYIQMDLASPIYDLATNKYGVDFVVYGNAFNGNPEAGAVKVFGYKAGDTTGAWYDLAGSLYYDSITKNNATVSYKKVTTIDSTFTETGIWYKINNGSWTKFTANTDWWPTANEYVNGWGSVDGVTWDQTNDTITYTGVSLVKDTDTTNDYQFGYFDIHVNGSDYGVAQNPYTITNTTKGGDGFDIAWAVDSNGKPVNLTHITKVRVYTAAALTSDGKKFTTPSIFGETSAEFCGIFATSNTISGGAGTTAAPTSVSIDNLTITPATNANVESRGNNVYYYHTTGGVSEAVITVAAASGANVFINGTAGTSLELSENTEVVQILVQSGNAAPYILVID